MEMYPHERASSGVNSFGYFGPARFFCVRAFVSASFSWPGSCKIRSRRKCYENVSLVAYRSKLSMFSTVSRFSNWSRYLRANCIFQYFAKSRRVNYRNTFGRSSCPLALFPINIESRRRIRTGRRRTTISPRNKLCRLESQIHRLWKQRFYS